MLATLQCAVILSIITVPKVVLELQGCHDPKRNKETDGACRTTVQDGYRLAIGQEPVHDLYEDFGAVCYVSHAEEGYDENTCPFQWVAPHCIEEISDHIQSDDVQASLSLHVAGTYTIQYDCVPDINIGPGYPTMRAHDTRIVVVEVKTNTTNTSVVNTKPIAALDAPLEVIAGPAEEGPALELEVKESDVHKQIQELQLVVEEAKAKAAVAAAAAPTTPTAAPSDAPTSAPTAPTTASSDVPTAAPTTPTAAPSDAPTAIPTAPTTSPSDAPTLVPTDWLVIIPSNSPSSSPTAAYSPHMAQFSPEELTSSWVTPNSPTQSVKHWSLLGTLLVLSTFAVCLKLQESEGTMPVSAEEGDIELHEMGEGLFGTAQADDDDIDGDIHPLLDLNQVECGIESEPTAARGVTHAADTLDTLAPVTGFTGDRHLGFR
jgi:hypothetical protein